MLDQTMIGRFFFIIRRIFAEKSFLERMIGISIDDYDSFLKLLRNNDIFTVL